MIPSFVWSDFLSWLWRVSDDGGRHVFPDGRGVEIVVEDRISFRDPDAATATASFKGEIRGDARQSFGIGKVVDSLSVVLRIEDDRSYEFRLGKGGIGAFKICLPLVTAASEGSISGALHENLLMLVEAEDVLHRLFLDFLDRRTGRSEEMLSQFLELGRPLGVG